MQYLDKNHSTVVADDGGIIPAIDGNRDWDDIVARGVVVKPWQPPMPTAQDVRQEASRRLQALLGARDPQHLDIIVANGTREAVRLLRIRDQRDWSAMESARAAALAEVDAAIEAIRAASNTLEAAPSADYADDSRWPAFD